MKYKNIFATIDNFCTFDTIKLGNRLVKISSLDNQILIHSFNSITLEYDLIMFTSEIEAFNYLERLYD